LRGLKAKQAVRQIAAFDERCHRSLILPLTDEIVVRAAEIYADLHRSGRLVSDADILIAATAMSNDLMLVTGNEGHFRRIVGLAVDNCHTSGI
jgi:tRNA(fMet)-specific endonuclease VapC